MTANHPIPVASVSCHPAEMRTIRPERFNEKLVKHKPVEGNDRVSWQSIACLAIALAPIGCLVLMFSKIIQTGMMTMYKPLSVSERGE